MQLSYGLGHTYQRSGRSQRRSRHEYEYRRLRTSPGTRYRAKRLLTNAFVAVEERLATVALYRADPGQGRGSGLDA
eukprot:scaffold321203_cov36-Prasinocladus_malaysianus.AAC.1